MLDVKRTVRGTPAALHTGMRTSAGLFLLLSATLVGCAADGAGPSGSGGGGGGKGDDGSEEGLHVRAETTELSEYSVIRWPVAVDEASEVDDIINTKLGFEDITGENLDELKRQHEAAGPDDVVHGVASADFEVNANIRNVLSLTISYETVYAYPDFHHAYFNFNSNTGAPIGITDLLTAESLPVIAAALDEQLQQRIAQLKVDFAAEIASGEVEATQWDELHVTTESLESFSTTPDGITFHYDAGFPHVIQALEPDGEFSVAFEDLYDAISGEGLWAEEW